MFVLCSGTLGRTTPIEVKADAAAAAGFDAVSVYAREVADGAALRRRLDDLGLAVAEVDGGLAWLPDRPGPDPAMVLDLAVTLGARSVTVLETTGEAVDVPEAADAFAAVCERARPLGLLVHLEPFAWSGIADLATAAAVVAGPVNGGILLDTWHLVRGPDAGEVLPAPADLVVGVQVSGTLPMPEPDVRDECLHRRELPDEQARAIIAALPSVPVGVEVFSDRLAALPPQDAATIAMQGWRS